MIDYVLQLVLAGLLTLTIVWCVLVHQKLRRFRAPEGETAVFIKALTTATDRASLLIGEIKDVAEAAENSMAKQERRLQAKLDQVNRLGRASEIGRTANHRKRAAASTGALSAGDPGGALASKRRNRDVRTATEPPTEIVSSRAAELMQALQGLR